VSDLSFAPTFVHTDWIDNVDRIVPGGPRGLNARLHAIEADLQGVASVVGQTNVEISRIGLPLPPTQIRRIALVPVLLSTGVSGALNWAIDPTGAAIASVSQSVVVDGFANVNPPDHARLTAFRIRGALATGATPPDLHLPVVFSRVPFGLTPTPPTPQALASTTVTASGNFDVTMQIPVAQAVVDLSAFRYVVHASFTTQNSGSATIQAIEFDFLPA
jgi:hypothetical protein